MATVGMRHFRQRSRTHGKDFTMPVTWSYFGSDLTLAAPLASTSAAYLPSGDRVTCSGVRPTAKDKRQAVSLQVHHAQGAGAIGAVQRPADIGIDQPVSVRRHRRAIGRFAGATSWPVSATFAPSTLNSMSLLTPWATT